jgi:hypothetical protein
VGCLIFSYVNYFLSIVVVVVKRRAWPVTPAKLHAPKLFALGVEQEETEVLEVLFMGVKRET